MEPKSLIDLQAENARLIALLEAHGIDWRRQPQPAPDFEASKLSTAEKIALFSRLFRGRTDIYPVRWESKSTGKSGYAPACGNEWRAGICEKPRIKCSECPNRQFLPLKDLTIYDHLAGKQVLGVYPLLPDDSCHFVAVDFDDAEWRAEAVAFARSCRDLGVPASIEVSRYGSGAHVWEAGRLLGLGERAARKVVSECVDDGLLTAASTRADLIPAYPVYAAAYLFPHLFEIDDPQAAMRETLMG